MDELKVHPARQGENWQTGIFVRAKNGEHWITADIAQLDRPSLMTWLRSRGGANEWAENTVAILLGHKTP